MRGEVKMKVDLIISADDIRDDKIKDKSVVVIDMLRATSVIVTAVKNGCKGVIPVLTVEEALDTVALDRKKFILGGERKALKIEGFDCSNSPLEYEDECVKGKTLVMTTSNGTRAIKGSSGARNILIGSMLNANALSKKLIELNNDIVFVNAGTYGEFSMDDFICSGYIMECIVNNSREKKIQLSDIASTAHYIYKSNTDVTSFIKYAKHYRVLIDLGLEEDLEYCCRKDITDIVPEYRNGIISCGE
jgi:2-phosphosulfolactate phosphatase